MWALGCELIISKTEKEAGRKSDVVTRITSFLCYFFLIDIILDRIIPITNGISAAEKAGRFVNIFIKYREDPYRLGATSFVVCNGLRR